jgi:hypothetical protein
MGQIIKMPKQYKRTAATYLDPHKRGEYLRSMKQAIIEGSKPVSREKVNNKKEK